MGDLMKALRGLARSPGFSLIAVVTLALCIGANSAVFSVIHAILLKPYPWKGSENLVYIYNTYPLMGLPNAGVSIPDYLDRRGVKGLADSAMYTGASLNVTGDAEPEMIKGLMATPSLFSTLQSTAAIGRVFDERDAEVGAAPTIVLSHDLWRDRYGSDAAIVGKTIRVNNAAYTVIGVMPETFYFPGPTTKAWVPFAFTDKQRSDDERGTEYSEMVARLVPGTSLESVQKQLDLIQANNAQRIPKSGYFWKTSGFHGTIVGFLDQNVQNVRSMLWLIQVGVAAALLIGCANVAGLLLSRALGREKELAIRTALGAGRGQLVRLLLTESVLLFLAGGLMGLLVALWIVDGLKGLGLSNLPRGFGVSLDPAVFAFTLACALVTGLVFGSLPAWSASKGNPSASLKEAGARGSAGRRTQRLRSLLVVSEIALAVMLVATAGLLIKSFVKLQQVDAGFLPGGILTAQATLPAAKYDKPEKIVAFSDAVISRLLASPGVKAAGTTDQLPFSGDTSSGSYSSPDIVLPPEAPQPHAYMTSADPGYLKAMGLTLLKGRWFNDADTANSQHVAVVDRVLVDRYWKGKDPIGMHIQRDCVVVGVVGTVKNQGLDVASDQETIYFPMSQNPLTYLTFVARTDGDPALLSPLISKAVHAVDPTQSVFDVKTMENRMDDMAQPRKAPMVLLSVFGGLAVVLAMLGVYGVLSFSVAQRTSEFGVRIALGATSGDIAGLVLRSGLTLTAWGIALGLAGYLAVSRLVATLLFGTASTDPLLLSLAPVALAAVAMAACFVPALRASSVDPITALRQE